MIVSLFNRTRWKLLFWRLCDCISLRKAKSKMGTRQWADLPSELTTLIADRLGIIDLLSFRSVCRRWNCAASSSSAQIESSPNVEPWFLLYGESSQCLVLGTSDKKYKINIPELNGATCIASNEGWLLLHQESSMFFFCPFSRSKIDLPQFPNEKLHEHIAAFSSPPTSKDCIVSVACRRAKWEVELYVLYRGAKEWTLHKYSPKGRVNTIRAVAYHDRTFHFYDDVDALVTFSPENGEWKIFRIVCSSKDNSPGTELLPFTLSRGTFRMKIMNQRLGLAEDVSVDTCGTVVPYDGSDMIFFNESISQRSGTQRRLKGVWIKPRFYKVSPEVSW